MAIVGGKPGGRAAAATVSAAMLVAAMSVAALLVAAAGFTAGRAQEPPLRTAVDGTFAPHAMPVLTGGIQGFNVDLANAIAKRLGRAIIIDATQYSGLIPALQAGTYDFLAAPVTATPERAESLLFTEGYLNTDYQFVVRREAPDITRLEDFRGKVIAVNKGSVYDSWARELDGRIGWTIESFGTNTDAVQAVISGRAFANVAGNTAVAWAAKSNPVIRLSYLHSTGLVWAIPVRKDNVDLRRRIDVAIECMKTDGTLAAMHEKWFGTAQAPGSAAATVYPGYGVPDMAGFDATAHPEACQ
jgi:polar amino acid transport system substrate-binding protein